MDDTIYEASKRCPKGVKNGPCGAMHDGCCERGGICAWADAYNTLKGQGKLDLLKDVIGAEKFGSKKEESHGLLVGHTLARLYKPRLKGAKAETESDAPAKPATPFQKKFAITCELDPPRGAKTDKMKEFLSNLPEIEGVNIVDNPMGKPVMSGILPSLLARKYGQTPIYQMTCRSKNTEAIQSDLFAAYACGVRHVLALTGDYVQSGIKPVFDIDSTILAQLLKNNLAEGIDFFGGNLDAPIDFFVGVAVNPNATPIEAEIAKFEKKMKFADFAQTQAVFDASVLERFRAAVSCPEKILIGVLAPTDAVMAENLSRVPGMKVPQEFIRNIRKNPSEGMVLAKEIVEQAKKLGFGGVHIMPMMDDGIVKKIIG